MSRETLPKIDVYLYNDPAVHGTCVYFEQRKDDGTVLIAKPIEIEWEDAIPGLYQQPTMVFDRYNGGHFLQSLAEGIIALGIQPDALQHKKDEVAAIREHLADMRRLVFEGTPINLQAKRG